MTLIELGAEVRYVRPGDGVNALDSAVVRADPKVLSALIDRGALIDGRAKDPITPLMRAAVEGNLEAVRLLIRRGADPSRKCDLPWAKGKTAAEMARQYGKHRVAEVLERA